MPPTDIDWTFGERIWNHIQTTHWLRVSRYQETLHTAVMHITHSVAVARWWGKNWYSQGQNANKLQKIANRRVLISLARRAKRSILTSISVCKLNGFSTFQGWKYLAGLDSLASAAVNTRTIPLLDATSSTEELPLVSIKFIWWKTPLSTSKPAIQRFTPSPSIRFSTFRNLAYFHIDVNHQIGQRKQQANEVKQIPGHGTRKAEAKIPWEDGGIIAPNYNLITKQYLEELPEYFRVLDFRPFDQSHENCLWQYLWWAWQMLTNALAAVFVIVILVICSLLSLVVVLLDTYIL